MSVMPILVNPVARTVTEVDFVEGEALAKLLDCEHVGHTVLGNVAAMFIDDHGQKFWSFRNAPAIVYGGRGLIYAVDDHGEAVDKLIPASMIEPFVVWRDEWVRC
jgi:hypothetical protein